MQTAPNKQWINWCLCILLIFNNRAESQKTKESFRVLAFYTAKNDLAHISFVQEANNWFYEKAREIGFVYDSTSNWERMNATELARYQIIVFLDTRPEKPAQRLAFQQYMEKGGAWMGFHFAAFALTPSAFNQDWNWYHETFLGSGQYKSNTWRPTRAVLQKETPKHPAAQGLPDTFRSAPNEWYRWENDLRKNKDIDVLLAIHPASFPLGTGPKAHEIWHNGDYPVAWTNRNYRMVYLNMGHNDMDYEGGSNRTLSQSFASEYQNRFILNALLWLGKNPDAE